MSAIKRQLFSHGETVLVFPLSNGDSNEEGTVLEELSDNFYAVAMGKNHRFCRVNASQLCARSKTAEKLHPLPKCSVCHDPGAIELHSDAKCRACIDCV